jgi:hypothetical protein
MGGTGRCALVLATSAACAGCFVAYHPTSPHDAYGDGVGAHIRAIDTFGDLAEITTLVRAPQGYRVGGAWLTTPAAAPCTGGATASSQSPGAIHADDRVLRFDLETTPAAGLLRASPTVMDLDLVPSDPTGARQCLRVPVTDGTNDVQWKARPRWFAAIGLRIIAAPPGVDPIRGGTLVSFGGGAWLGPVRLRLDWLFGEAGTSQAPPPGYGNPTAQLIGGDVAAEMFPIHLGELGIGAQVGYEYLATDFNSQQGTNENDDYDGRGPRGPRVALRIARLPDPRGWSAFQARPDHWSMGIDLFAARWTGLPGLTPMRYGIAFSGEWGRWW